MKSPAFSFYVRDWLCSKTVARLHAAALPKFYETATKPLPTDYQVPSITTNLRSRGVAAYMFLLCHAWLEEPPATLPNDDDELAALGLISRQEWDAIKPLLMPALKIDEASGRLYSERQMEEWLKQSNRSKANTKNVRTRYQSSTKPLRTLEDANANEDSGIKEGSGNHQGPWEPDREWAMDWLEKSNSNGSDYGEKETISAFLALQAGGWMWGRNPVTDHRAALERQIQTDRNKNEKRTGNRPNQGNPIRAGFTNL